MYRGIVANQLSLDTVGHNITNASTEGFSRQKVNQAATLSQNIYTVYGQKQVGTGTDALSIMRARNVYADKQYWKEHATQSYYTAKQVNYDKMESIFNDSQDTGVQNAMEMFYKTWVDLSANASTTSNRTTVIEQATVFIDRISTAATQVQNQITAEYDDLLAHVDMINDLSNKIVELNKNISLVEATGSYANDLRDSRDLLADELASYLNINVYEDNDNGSYQIVCNGASLVNGFSALHLEMVNPTANKKYGITDYTLKIKETDTIFNPSDGIIKAELDDVVEDKGYLDKLANMAAFMMTTFNEQHRAGYGLDGNVVDISKTNINFFGDKDTIYTWDDAKQQVIATPKGGGAADTLEGIEIIKAFLVNSQLTDPNGTEYVCAAGETLRSTASEATTDPEGTTITFEKDPETGKDIKRVVEVKAGQKTTTIYSINGTADGSNAVLVSALFNEVQGNCVNKTDARSIGTISLEAYYNAAMSELGAAAEAMDDMVDAQEIIITQVTTWRSSTSGVNWNEELTNMITFQTGYNACSRCLTTMDEMLDRLINSTGVVGR